jgi:hypothetical protein
MLGTGLKVKIFMQNENVLGKKNVNISNNLHKARNFTTKQGKFVNINPRLELIHMYEFMYIYMYVCLFYIQRQFCLIHSVKNGTFAAVARVEVFWLQVPGPLLITAYKTG